MSKASRRKKPAVPPSLEEAMEDVFQITQLSEKGTENRIPTLYLWAPDGGLTIVALAVDGSGPQFACAARIMVFKEEPVMAVVTVEGWNIDLDTTIPTEQQDPIVRDWLERRARGENLRITDLPADYIGETLHVIGEDATGNMADWMFKIRPALGKGKRTFERMEGFTVQDSVFHPLFLMPWAQKQGIGDAQIRASLRNEMRQAGLARGLF